VVRTIAAGILFTLSGALAVVALLVAFTLIRSRFTNRRQPAVGVLNTVTFGYGGEASSHVELSGVLVNPPSTTAPLSHRDCLLWDVTLLERLEGEDGPYWSPMWETGGAGDLVVGYELRRRAPARAVPAPGQVSVPGARVTWMQAPAGSLGVLLEATAGQEWGAGEVSLDGIGVPDDVAERVRAAPANFRLVERLLLTGAPIRLSQGPLPAGRPLPDPESDFRLEPASKERMIKMTLGCLVPALLIVAFFLTVLALVLLKK
jgi:hypothetical protein